MNERGATWEDGTPRSQNNGFTVGFGDTSAIWLAMAKEDQMRAKSSETMQKRRENDSARDIVINPKKAQLAKTSAQVQGRKRGGPRNPESATGRMREALKAGPLYGRELAAVGGVKASVVKALMKWDIHKGRVRQLKDTYPMRYELVQEAA